MGSPQPKIEYLDEPSASASGITYLDEVPASPKIEYLDDPQASSKIEYLDSDLRSPEQPLTRGLFGSSIGEDSSVLATLRKPQEFAEKGFQQLLDTLIPEKKEPRETFAPKTNQQVSKEMLGGIPGAFKEAGREIGTFGASVLDPEGALLLGAGKLAGPVIRGAGKLFNTLDTKVTQAFPKATQVFKSIFTYGKGLPEGVQEAKEVARVETILGSVAAKEAEEALTSDLTKSERLRVGQILAGGTSIGEKETILRQRAAGVREELNQLKGRAQEEGLLGQESYFTKLSRARVNDLRLEKEKLSQQIDNILGLPTREKIQKLMGNIFVKGKESVISRIDGLKEAIRNTPDVVTDDLLNIGKGVVKDYDLLEQKAAKLLDIPTGQRAKLKDLVSSLRGASNKQKAGILHQIIDLSDNARAAGYEVRTRLLERLGALEDFTNKIATGGLGQLQKFASEFTTRFKGRAGLLEEVRDKIAAIDDRLWINKMYGGTPYAPRLYLSKELEKMDKKGFFGTLAMKIKGDAFKRRGFFTPEEELSMGKITEPAYPYATRIKQISSDVATAKLFRGVAENPEWASGQAKAGFSLLEGKQYGKLSGAYVRDDIYKDIVSMTQAPTTFGKLMKGITRTWKIGKTVVDPAVQATNTLGNVILLHLSGTDILTQPGLLRKALTEIKTKGPAFTELQKSGALGGDFSASELLDSLALKAPLEGNWDHLADIGKLPFKKASELYQFNEKLFKMAKYLDGKGKGLSVEAAAKEADKWLINYGKVSTAVKTLRDNPVGIPFLTFWSKVIPLVAETAVKNPFRLYQFKLMADAVEKNAIDKLGLSDKEVELIHRNTKGLGMILPFRDDKGAPQVLSLGRVFFPSSIFDTQGGILGMPQSLTPGGLLTPLYEVWHNRVGYRMGQRVGGDEIYKEADSSGTKTRKQIDHLYRAYFPSWMPPLPGLSKGGTSTQKFLSSREVQPIVEKIPGADKVIPEVGKIGDYFGRVRGVAAVLFDTLLGLKAHPMDPELLEALEQTEIGKQIRAAKEKASIIKKNQGLTDEEKEKQLAEVEEEFARILINASELEGEWSQ